VCELSNQLAETKAHTNRQGQETADEGGTNDCERRGRYEWILVACGLWHVIGP
jgi:hypothetical protein